MKRIVLSTSSVNRYGYRVLTSGIDLTAFLKNPIMLLLHDNDKLPIGTWTDIKVEGDVLSGVPVFHEKTAKSKEAKLLFEDGTLKAASIGFLVKEESTDVSDILPGQKWATVKKCELIEVSLVSVPANSDALIMELSLNFDKNLKLLSVNNKQEIPMSLTKIALHLGLKEDATEDAVMTAIDAIKATQAEAVLQLGIDKGIVDDSNRKVYEAAIKNDLEATKAYFLAFKKDSEPTPTEPNKETLAQKLAAQRAATPTPTAAPNSDRSAWSLLDWQEKDPQGLRQLRLNDVVAYDALVNKHLLA